MLSLLLMFGEGSLLFAGDTVIVPEHELVEASNQRPKIFFQRVFSRIQSGAQRPGHGSSAGNDQNRVKPGLFRGWRQTRRDYRESVAARKAEAEANQIVEEVDSPEETIVELTPREKLEQSCSWDTTSFREEDPSSFLPKLAEAFLKNKPLVIDIKWGGCSGCQAIEKEDELAGVRNSNEVIFAEIPWRLKMDSREAERGFELASLEDLLNVKTQKAAEELSPENSSVNPSFVLAALTRFSEGETTGKPTSLRRVRNGQIGELDPVHTYHADENGDPVDREHFPNILFIDPRGIDIESLTNLCAAARKGGVIRRPGRIQFINSNRWTVLNQLNREHRKDALDVLSQDAFIASLGMEDLFTKSYDGRLRFRGSEFYRLVNQVVSRHKENSDSDLRFQMPNDVQRISEVSSSPSSSTPRVDVSASMTVARSDGSESLDMLSSNIVTPSPSPAPIQSDTGMDRLLSEIFAESGL